MLVSAKPSMQLGLLRTKPTPASPQSAQSAIDAIAAARVSAVACLLGYHSWAPELIGVEAIWLFFHQSAGGFAPHDCS